MLARMRTRAPSLLVLACTFAACKPAPTPSEPEPTPGSDDAAPVDPTEGGTPTDPPIPGAPEDHPYDFVVSFISPGDGTDHEAESRLEAIVAATKGLEHARGTWGREGEHDECFMLGGLSAADRDAFVARVRAEVGNSKKVNISEGAACQHQPR
jgi:hypothetical protein